MDEATWRKMDRIVRAYMAEHKQELNAKYKSFRESGMPNDEALDSLTAYLKEQLKKRALN